MMTLFKFMKVLVVVSFVAQLNVPPLNYYESSGYSDFRILSNIIRQVIIFVILLVYSILAL